MGKKDEKDSDLEKVLKIKAAYDLHTIADDVRERQAQEAKRKYLDSIDEIEREDIESYIKDTEYKDYLEMKKNPKKRIIDSVTMGSGVFFIGVGIMVIFKYDSLVLYLILFLSSIWATYFISKTTKSKFEEQDLRWKDGFKINVEEVAEIHASLSINQALGYRILSDYTHKRKMAIAKERVENSLKYLKIDKVD